jgi:hypothetical protein
MPEDAKHDDPRIAEWSKESDRLFLILLEKIAAAVGYDFEELLLKKGAYSPKAHGDIENDQLFLRKGLLNLLAGNSSLKMQLTSAPQPDEEDLRRQKRLQELTIEYFEGKRPLPVTVIDQKRDEAAS